MTYKNAKIILFASLLVAMILPFSGMMMAEAAPNENANDKAKKTHKQWVAEGYSVFPGGHYIKDTQKGIDNNKSIDENVKNGFDRDVLKSHNGKTILDLDKYIEKHGEEVKNTKTNFPVADGYNTIIAIDEDDSMTYFKAVWDVPNAPVEYTDGDTIFTFNAIQPFGVGTDVIFQPVLQYGDSGPCPNNDEGEFWIYYPLIYISPTLYNIGDCTEVDEGDELKGYIYKSGTTWYVTTYINGSYDSSTSVGYSGKGDFSSLALETYGLPEDCDVIPGDEEFSQIYIVGDTEPWVDISSQGVGQWCGMDTNVVSSNTSGSGKIQLTNDN